MNKYSQNIIEALAYLEKNSSLEETINIRQGLRESAQYIENGLTYKPKKYEIVINNRPIPGWRFDIESDAQKFANHLGEDAFIREAV